MYVLCGFDEMIQQECCFFVIETMIPFFVGLSDISGSLASLKTKGGRGSLFFLFFLDPARESYSVRLKK
jgi:hypothetical protein